MDHQATLDLIIQHIYEGATDSKNWQLALEETARLTDASCGNAQTRRHADLLEIVVWNLPMQELGIDYVREAASRDEWSKRKPLPPFVGAVRGSELFSFHELKRTAFYEEFCEPFDMAHLVASMFFNDGEHFGAFSVWRPEWMDDFTEKEARFFETLTPHLSRAFRFASRLRAAEVRRQRSEWALDQLNLAIALVTENGRVLFANRAAEAILREGDGLSVRCGRLVGSGCANAPRLARILLEAGRRDRPRVGGVASMVRTGDRRPLQVWAMPLPLEEPIGLLFKPVGSVCVLIVDPDRKPMPQASALKTLYRLTDAEAQLVLGLLAGERLADYAERAEITMNTARTHLKAVFAKTETSRQVGLVRCSPRRCFDCPLPTAKVDARLTRSGEERR